MKAILFLTCALLISACGNDKGGNNNPTPPPLQPKQRPAPELGGDQSDGLEYFRKVMSDADKYCAGMTQEYQIHRAEVDLDFSGKVQAVIELSISGDGSYYAHYEEQLTEAGKTSRMFRKDIYSSWEIGDQGQMILKSLGEVWPRRYSERSLIAIKFSENQRLLGLKDQSTDLIRKVFHESDRESFCSPKQIGDNNEST